MQKYFAKEKLFGKSFFQKNILIFQIGSITYIFFLKPISINLFVFKPQFQEFPKVNSFWILFFKLKNVLKGILHIHHLCILVEGILEFWSRIELLSGIFRLIVCHLNR